MFGKWLIVLGCLEIVEWLVARKKEKVENALDMFGVPLAKIR